MIRLWSRRETRESPPPFHVALFEHVQAFLDMRGARIPRFLSTATSTAASIEIGGKRYHLLIVEETRR